MELKIYGEKNKEDKIARLRIIKEGQKIVVVLVDDEGDSLMSGNVMCFGIGQDGKLVYRRCQSVNSELVHVDGSSAIKEESYEI